MAEQLDDEQRITSVETRAPRIRFGESRSAPRCPACGGKKPRRAARCDGCFGLKLTVALVSSITRYSEDVAAQLFVAALPDGGTLEQVGEALGISKERVRQIETEALKRMRARAKLADIDEAELALVLSRRGVTAGAEPVGVTGEDGRPPGVRAITASALETSEATQRLIDTLDEVIAIGELVARAARYASEGT